MKNKVVIWKEDCCWVLTNPEPNEYESLPHVVNPNLTLLRGIPPEEWEILDGVVVSKLKTTLPSIARSTSELQGDVDHLLSAVQEIKMDKAVSLIDERLAASETELKLTVNNLEKLTKRASHLTILAGLLLIAVLIHTVELFIGQS